MVYALGLSLGNSTLTTAVAQAGPALHPGAPAATSTVPALVYTDGHTLHTGSRAELRGVGSPDRVAAHVLDKLAAGAPVRVADRSYPADQLLQRMVADRIADLTAQHRGQPPAQLVLTHPTRWPAAAVAALRAATDPLAASAGSLQLVPHAIAAAIAYAADHPVPDGAAVARVRRRRHHRRGVPRPPPRR